MLHGIVVVDAWLVASLGEEALAAMGLASAVGGLLLGAQNAFSNAAQILVAQAWGSGRPEALRSNYRTSVLINLSVCAIGLGFLALSAEPILRASAHSEEVFLGARNYLLIFSGVVIAEAFGQSLSAFFNGCGETRAPFYSYVFSVPINIALSYALIHGVWGMPALGLAGAALGSVVGSAVRAGYLLFRVSQDQGHWRSAQLEPLWPAARRHLAFALPIAATFFSAQASASVCMLIYAAYDVYQFAALTLMLPWVHVAGTFGMAWAQATGIVVAQHLGQGGGRAKLDAFLWMAWRGVMVSSLAVAAIYACVVLFAGEIYDGIDGRTRAALLTFLPTLLLLPWPKNSNAICGNTLRAAGRTVYVMHIFVWPQWAFKVPLSAAMVLWWHAPVGWVFAILFAEELLKFIPFHRGLLWGEWKRSLPD